MNIDQTIVKFIATLRTPWLDQSMLFVTDIGLYIFLLFLTLLLLKKKKGNILILLTLSAGITLEISYLLKRFFQVPRPYHTENLSDIALTQASGYAFPSMHATICSAIIAFLPKIFPKKRVHIPLMFFILLIIMSRIYLGVHYLSDLLAGSIIGYVIARVILYSEEKYQFTSWFREHIKSKLELRRQIAHAFSALSIALLIKFDLLPPVALFLLILVGIACSLFVKYQKIPFIFHLLRRFERKDHLTQFPGKGAIYLLIGSFIVVIFFPKSIALASIMIMGLGDAVSTLIGTYFGKLKNPLNPVKHLEGTVLAIIISTIGAFNFVPFQMAFLGATFAMAWEIFSIRFLDKTFDDNLIIPLIAALTMSAMT